MRGSIKWQVTQLVKLIFEQNISKSDRTDINSDKYNMVTQSTTMQTYKLVWIQLGIYVKQHHRLLDLELLTNNHIKSFLNYKISSGIAKQTLEKLSSAIGKLEYTLTLFSQKNRIYNFNSRLKLLAYAKEFELVYDGYHNRAYIDAEEIINTMKNDSYRLAAKLQLEGGARIGGVEYLKSEMSISYQKLVVNQLEDLLSINKVMDKKAFFSPLQGIVNDPVLENKNIIKKVGQILTIEKGGKPGFIYVKLNTYNELKKMLSDEGVFEVCRFSYIKNIEKICKKLGLGSEASHGFRWTHIQNRQKELVMAGFSFDESMLINSIEHKHWRKEITSHYLG